MLLNNKNCTYAARPDSKVNFHCMLQNEKQIFETFNTVKNIVSKRHTFIKILKVIIDHKKNLYNYAYLAAINISKNYNIQN